MSASAYDVGTRGRVDSSRRPARAAGGALQAAADAGALARARSTAWLPVLWVFIALTKTRGELFSTFTFLPSFGSGLFENIADLFAYEGGRFWRWGLNSVLLRRRRLGAVGGRLRAGRLRAGQVPLPRPRARCSTSCSPAC